MSGKDGSMRTFLTRGVAVRDATGKPIRFAGTAVDITDLKHAEESLAYERFLLHALMDNVPDQIYFKDRESRFVRINKSQAEVLGLADPCQAVGKTDFDFFAEEHARAAYEDEQQIIRTGQPLVGKEEKETYGEGRVRWVSTTKMPFRDSDGKLIGTFGVSRDITEVKRAGEALRASEARFRALVQNSSDIISLFDAEGTVLYHSPAVERLLGYRLQDRIGRNIFRDPIVYPDDLDRKRAFFDAIRNQPGALVTSEFRLQRADGSWRDIEAVGQNFLDDPGIAGIVTNYRDVTERKRAEEDIRRAKEEWERTFDSVPDLIAILDDHHQVIRANRAMAQRLGTTPQQCVGLPCYQVVHGTDAPPSFCPHVQTLRDLQLHTEEIHEDRLGGDFLVTTTPLMDEQGKFLGAVHVARDVTERKRAEDALRASEQRFRVFVDHATDAFFLHDETSRILDANRQACESLGIQRWKNWPECIRSTSTRMSLPPLSKRSIANSTPERRSRSGPDTAARMGRFSPVEVRSQAFWEGERRFSVSLARDITEQKRTEEAMAERARLASLAADVGVALTGADTLSGILQPCTEALVRHLGASFARIWTLNEAENVLELRASAGIYTRTDGTFSRVPVVGRFKLGLIAQERRPYLTNDVLNDPLIHDPEWARREGMVASAGHPLMVQDRVVGVMILFCASRSRRRRSRRWPPWLTRSPWASSASGKRRRCARARSGSAAPSKMRPWELLTPTPAVGSCASTKSTARLLATDAKS